MSEDIEVREAKVSYTTKELLQRIDDRFERLEGIAQGMARREDVERIESRVEALEKEAGEVRAVATALLTTGKDRFTRNEKLFGATAVLITTVLNLMALGPDVIHAALIFH
jgi:tetrahydromethanopterin S-methyltransferase subunit G